MSLLRLAKLAVGRSPTPANNFTLRTLADAVLRFSRGNPGSETEDVMTVGADSKVRFPFGGLGAQQMFPVSASAAANAMTIGLDVCAMEVRSATLTIGKPNLRFVNNALSLVIPQGATLGTVNGQASCLLILALDVAGTIELAVANMAGGVNLDESGLISTTAINGSSTSASVVYSQNARASVPYRVVGAVYSTQATAGTWASQPTLVQPCGGQALAAMASFGVGQTLQNVTASRAVGTTYYNLTGKTIWVAIRTVLPSSFGQAKLTVDGKIADEYANPSSGATNVASFRAPVPHGFGYALVNISGSASVTEWNELR